MSKSKKQSNRGRIGSRGNQQEMRFSWRREYTKVRNWAGSTFVTINLLICMGVQQAQASPLLVLPEGLIGCLVGSCTQSPIPAPATPTGAPMPWQGFHDAGPFSVVNLSNGVLFTTIPIVAWNGGGNVEFNLYHSPGSPTPLPTMSSSWTHSYSDTLRVSGSTAAYYTADGRTIIFTLVNNEGENDIYRLKLALDSGTNQWVITSADQSKLVFVSSGTLLRTLDRDGHATTLAYLGGLLRTITDEVGRSLTLNYTNGKLTGITAPPLKVYTSEGEFDDVPREWELAYQPKRGYLEYVKSPRLAANDEPFQIKLTNSSIAFIGSITDYRPSDADLSDYTTDYKYSQDSLTRIVHPPVADYVAGGTPRADRTLAYTTISGGTRTVVTDERNATWTYEFDSGGRVVLEKDPLNRSLLRATWSIANRPCAITNVLGGALSFDYDTNGNPQSITDPRGIFLTSFDSSNNITAFTDPVGTVTSFLYQDVSFPNVLTAVDGTADADITLTYDSLSLLSDIDGSTGVKTKVIYDSNRNPDRTDFGVTGDHDFLFNDTGEQLMAHEQQIDEMVYTPGTGNEQHFPPYDGPGAGGGPAGCSCPSEADASGNLGGLPSPGSCGGGAEAGGGGSTFTYDGNNRILTAADEVTFTYDARGREITYEQHSRPLASSGVSPGDVNPGVFKVKREYSDSAGKLRVVTSNIISIETLCEVTEYATDSAGRVTSVKKASWVGTAGSCDSGMPSLPVDPDIAYAYQDSTTQPAITETRLDSKTLITLDSDGQQRVMEHRKLSPDELIQRFTYTRDANGRITQAVEDRRVGAQDLSATTTYAYGDGYVEASELDPDSTQALDPTKLQYSFLPSSARRHGDPNRLVKERRYGSDPALGPYYKRKYWYEPTGNRLAMRESTPGATEAQDVITALTRYNYWKQALLLTNTVKEPGTPSAIDAYTAGAAKDQLLTAQRFDVTVSPPIVTGTIYRYGVTDGSVHRNGLTHEVVVISVKVASTWEKRYEENVRHSYASFAFLRRVKGDWRRWNTDNCITQRGAYEENYNYDLFGRIAGRVHLACDETCTPDPACVGACGSGPYACDFFHDTPTVVRQTVYYGYDGISSRILSELGSDKKDPLTDVYSLWMHATLTPGMFGTALRYDRNGTTDDLTDDRQIELLTDGRLNNVALAKRNAVDPLQVDVEFEQTDAFGDRMAPVDGLADLGSFSWRGREETISFGFLTTEDHYTGLYRMGDRAFDSPNGRFTQADRLILNGFTPLAANRYAYAIADPVNHTDPTGFEETLTGLQVASAISARLGTISFQYGSFGGSVVSVGTGAKFVNIGLQGGFSVQLQANAKYLVEMTNTMCRLLRGNPGTFGYIRPS